MTLCPVALAIGCGKCPVFKPCPLKSVIGDFKPAAADPANAQASGNGKRSE